jgi:hypothetical protein
MKKQRTATEHAQSGAERADVAGGEGVKRGRLGRRTGKERREAVLALLAGKASADQLASQYGVLPATIVKWRDDAIEVGMQTGNGPSPQELRTDHGPQYTAEDCVDLCRAWRLDHTFAPVGRPTGNSVAERLIRTMKEECIWLRD